MSASDWFVERLGLFLSTESLPSSLCRRARDLASAVETVASTVYRAGHDQPEVLTSARKSRRVYPTPEVSAAVEQFLIEQVDAAAHHFGMDLGGLEELQFLHYQSGDFFHRHRDARRADDGSLPAERRVSLVMGLSPASDFTGGEFMVFPELALLDGAGFEVQLAEGQLLAFPADLSHEVRPVRSGNRHSVVSWAS